MLRHSCSVSVLIMCREECKLLKLLVLGLSPASPQFISSSPYILLSTVLSDTLARFSSLNVVDSSFTPIQNNRRRRCVFLYLNIALVYDINGVWGSVVVKALRFWSDGPGIDSRWCHWEFFPWYSRHNHVS